MNETSCPKCESKKLKIFNGPKKIRTPDFKFIIITGYECLQCGRRFKGEEEEK